MNQPSVSPGTQASSIRSKAIDEKFCASCGEIIKIKAEICPRCGVRQKGVLNKTALLLITFFLGGIGAHKFYTGKNWQGVFYILFCWTGIPGLIALIEFIVYACTSSEKLQEKYSGSGGGIVVAVIAGAIGFISIAGILAAIAIPQFVAYRNRAYQVAVKSELQNMWVAQNAFFVEHNRYSSDMGDLNLPQDTPNVSIEIVSADENCFEAIGLHRHLNATMSIDCKGFDPN